MPNKAKSLANARPETGFTIALLTIVLTIVGCAGSDETGPGEVRWDRDTCARCVMAVSDRNYSAQVRGGPAQQRTKLNFFDDIGCAVFWLGEQGWRDDPRTEIWVNDCESGEWIDARQAWFVTGKTTPMDFGLGAVRDSVAGSLDYEQAVEHIHNRGQRAR